MLNKEQLIANWRNQLALQDTVLPENLDEIEDHLRTSITSLEKQGLSDDEAFLVATKRMGITDKLADEFGKVNNNAMWIQRFSWMIIGLILFQMLSEAWKLFAEGIGWTALIYVSSPQISSILFVLISISLPVAIWLFVRGTVRGELDFQQYLDVIIHFLARKPKISFGILTIVLALIPITGFLMRVIGASSIPVSAFGEFQYGITLYQLAAGLLLPIVYLTILGWLYQQRRNILLDS